MYLVGPTSGKKNAKRSVHLLGEPTALLDLDHLLHTRLFDLFWRGGLATRLGRGLKPFDGVQVGPSHGLDVLLHRLSVKVSANLFWQFFVELKEAHAVPEGVAALHLGGRVDHLGLPLLKLAATHDQLTQGTIQWVRLSHHTFWLKLLKFIH